MWTGRVLQAWIPHWTQVHCAFRVPTEGMGGPVRPGPRGQDRQEGQRTSGNGLEGAGHGDGWTLSGEDGGGRGSRWRRS